MSSPSKKIVRRAVKRKVSTDSESSDLSFSSFDSDCDPQFLLSSNEELPSADESGLHFLITQREKALHHIDIDERQPCCSKSLSQKYPMPESLADNPEDNSSLKKNIDVTNKLPGVENIVEESEDEACMEENNTWKKPSGNHQIFEYNANGGIHANYAAAIINDLSPITCFRTFINDVIIDKMVEETNLYATQVLLDAGDISAKSRLHRWLPTQKEEMLKFIGIMAYMGMVKMPSFDKYWSKDVLYNIGVIPKTMTRNRFQLLLRLWHFSNNATCPEGDRLYKIQPLLENLIENFQAVFTPGRTICIDESIIPFQGRLVIRQYLPQKAHKYGVKIFKLCSNNGYTWNICLYARKEKNKGIRSVPSNIVIKLSEDLLNSGRTIIADNYYTSLDLCHFLLNHKTHYVGTLRANRREIPQQVKQKKLKKGEVYGLENERGVCVLKWHDKRDVLLLTSKHTTETVDVQRRDGIIKKPRAAVEYNEGKSAIDQSDQMSNYQSPLRKSIKWYRKLAIEFVLGTAMVNAHIVYNRLANKKIKIADFRERVIRSLLGLDEEESQRLEDYRRHPSQRTHKLQKKDGKFNKVRKYCKGCYAKTLRGEITKNRVKKVVTYCDGCDDQPHFCLDCFNENHK